VNYVDPSGFREDEFGASDNSCISTNSEYYYIGTAEEADKLYDHLNEGKAIFSAGLGAGIGSIGGTGGAIIGAIIGEAIGSSLEGTSLAPGDMVIITEYMVDIGDGWFRFETETYIITPLNSTNLNAGEIKYHQHQVTDYRFMGPEDAHPMIEPYRNW
jgi:hypothetical protein